MRRVGSRERARIPRRVLRAKRPGSPEAVEARPYQNRSVEFLGKRSYTRGLPRVRAMDRLRFLNQKLGKRRSPPEKHAASQRLERMRRHLEASQPPAVAATKSRRVK